LDILFYFKSKMTSNQEKERKNQDNTNKEIFEMINVYKGTKELLADENNDGELTLQHCVTVIDMKKRLEQFCANPDSDQGLVEIVIDYLQRMGKIRTKINIDIEL
jgi:hypothetical protein